MKMKLALAMAVLCASTLALAQNSDKEKPKWSYLEAGYMDFSPDAGLSDDGWYAGGSAGIAMFHIFAEYDDIGEYTFWNAGFGWHGLLGDPADLYFQAQWNDVSVDTSNFSDDGYQLSAGVRWKVLNWLEVMGQANWADYDATGDDWSGEVGILFSILKDRLGFGAEYQLVESSDTLRGYIRWSFGR